MTQEDTQEYRKRAAKAARAYLTKEVPWDRFIAEFAETEDHLVGTLVDLIEHEPSRGGLFGLKEKEWADYQSRVEEAIRDLEA